MPCNTPLLLSYIMSQDGSLNVKLTGFLQGLKALATKQLAIKSESDTNNYLCWLWVCWRMGSHILAIPRDCHLFSFFFDSLNEGWWLSEATLVQLFSSVLCLREGKGDLSCLLTLSVTPLGHGLLQSVCVFDPEQRGQVLLQIPGHLCSPCIFINLFLDMNLQWRWKTLWHSICSSLLDI